MVGNWFWNQMLFLMLYLGSSAVEGNECYLGQVPDPSLSGKHRWVLVTSAGHHRCSCTSLQLAGLLNAPLVPHQPYYIDRPLFTSDQEKIADLLRCGVEFSLIGKPAEMSSTYRARTAAKAVDGNVDTQTNGNCAHSGGSDASAEYDPWWRVDLEGEHCITQVSILNRGFCCSERTTHAVIRAGPSLNITYNPTCGSPVSAEEAAPRGGLIHKACDPPLRARYVSVDIPVFTILNFCEVTVKEILLSECP